MKELSNHKNVSIETTIKDPTQKKKNLQSSLQNIPAEQKTLKHVKIYKKTKYKNKQKTKNKTHIHVPSNVTPTLLKWLRN